MGVVVVAIRGVGVFDVGRGISGRAHVGGKRVERCVLKSRRIGSNTEISRRVHLLYTLANPTLTLFPPFLPRYSLSLSTPSQLKVLPGIRRITQWVVNGRHLIRSFPFETETKKAQSRLSLQGSTADRATRLSFPGFHFAGSSRDINSCIIFILF